MNDLIKEIQSKITSKILIDYDMGKATWFRAGGKAKGFVMINNIKDLKTILTFKENLKYYFIGVGSNLLVRDSGFNGLIIKLGKNYNNIKIKKNVLSVGAGVLDINLSRFASRNSIKGFEFFTGIRNFPKVGLVRIRLRFSSSTDLRYSRSSVIFYSR